MKFIHVVTIEQLEDGSTQLTQDTRKEGEGEPSEQMKFEVARYYETFGRYFSNYNTGLSKQSVPQLHLFPHRRIVGKG